MLGAVADSERAELVVTVKAGRATPRETTVQVLPNDGHGEIVHGRHCRLVLNLIDFSHLFINREVTGAAKVFPA